jgi:elongation factor Ts
VKDAINSAIATIGENMTLRRAAQVSVVAGAIGNYIHNSVTEGLGKIGVIVALESSGHADELVALGRLVAMHIAASNPQAVDATGLDPQVVAREKDILADKFRAQGKPEATIVKIVESGLKTFYKEACLLDQPYIHDPDKTVAQALKDAEAKVGGAIKVAGFVRYALGEGIDRPDDDFASEVAAAAGR